MSEKTLNPPDEQFEKELDQYDIELRRELDELFGLKLAPDHAKKLKEEKDKDNE